MCNHRINTSNLRGFTLLESMVVVLLLGIIAIGLMQVLTTSRDSYEQQKVTLEMQQNARVGIESMAEDFRHVSYGKDPTQPSIQFAGSDSVTFVADIIPDIPGAEMIGYSLSTGGDADTPNPTDTILMKTVRDSGGVVIYVEPQAYGIKSGGLDFRYFNGAGTELSTPVPAPELIGEAMLSVTTVEPQQYRNTGEYLEQTLTMTIYPRNLPLTPSRSRPSMPAMGTLGNPDCQSVTVPWSTPTTNTDGTDLEFGHISHFTIYFGTHPDSMSLYSRVARTINIWTVTSLNSNQQYYFGVTCSSRSGVESHMGVASFNLSSSFFPDVATSFNITSNPSGSGLLISWNTVTDYTNGDPITTPVTYTLYRSGSPGVVADPSNFLAEIPSFTSYIDSNLAPCMAYYYTVTASACTNEGSTSAEIYASEPSPPGCVGYVSASMTGISGEIQVYWSPPSSRLDGSPFVTDDYSSARIYYSQTSLDYTQYVDVTGPVYDYLLTGLTPCVAYFINVACYDQCPTLGDVCSYREFMINMVEPCDTEIPDAVTGMRAESGDSYVSLTWPANTTDCDLYGYQLYYGDTIGGPYNGTGAAEGSSPITLDANSVTGADDSCRVTLTGLSLCQTYSTVVTAIDGCSPVNVSSISPEASALTECSPCDIDVGCVSYITRNPEFEEVHLEIYPADGLAETITGLVLNWTGAALISEAWAGRPLVKVWGADGSAGEDGDVGLQPSESELDVDDFALSASAVNQDGMPLKLLLDSSMVGQTIGVNFRGGSGGLCSSDPRQVLQGIVFDNFESGLTGWTTTAGNWSITDGTLYQSTTENVCKAVYGSGYTDFTYEAKVKIAAGSTPYILFRVQDANNYYMFGPKLSSNVVRIGKYTNGSWAEVANTAASLSTNTWYQLRVEIQGTNIKAYLDCNLMLDINDNNIYPSGGLGFRTFQTRAYFDDVRVFIPLGG